MNVNQLPAGWPEVIPTGADKFFTVMVDDFQGNFISRLADLESRGVYPGICVAMQYLTDEDGTAYTVPSYNRGTLRKPSDNPNKTFKWRDIEEAQRRGCDLAYHGYAHPFDSISQSAMPSDFESFMATMVAHNESAAKKIKITGYIGPNGVNMPVQMIQHFCWARPAPGQGYGASYGVTNFRNIGCCYENGLWLDKTQDPKDGDGRAYYVTSSEKIRTDIVPNGKCAGGKFLNLSFHAYTAENVRSWQDILDLIDYLIDSGFTAVSPMRSVTYSLCASGDLGANSPVAIAGVAYGKLATALVGGYNVTGAAGNYKYNAASISTDLPLWNWWDVGGDEPPVDPDEPDEPDDPTPPSRGVLSAHIRLTRGGTISRYEELPPWVRERLERVPERQEDKEKLWYMKNGKKNEITWG